MIRGRPYGHGPAATLALAHMTEHPEATDAQLMGLSHLSQYTIRLLRIEASIPRPPKPAREPSPKLPRRVGPMPEQWSVRNQEIVAYLTAHPAEQYESVRGRFPATDGSYLSRERIRQLAQRAGLPAHNAGWHRGPFFRTCRDCGRVDQVISYAHTLSRCAPCGHKAGGSARKPPVLYDAACDLCGDDFQQTRYQRSQRIIYHRKQPNARTLCPDCFRRWAWVTLPRHYADEPEPLTFGEYMARRRGTT